jgi:hypothetical protein
MLLALPLCESASPLVSDINLQAHQGRVKPQGLDVVGNHQDATNVSTHILVCTSQPLFPNYDRFDPCDICLRIYLSNRPPQRLAPFLESCLDREIEIC